MNGLLNAKKYNKNLKLNFGYGKNNIPGYLGVDEDSKESDILMDVSQKLDLDNESIEEITSTYIFQFFDQQKVYEIFKEWNRVLKQNGKLIIEIPKIENILNINTSDNNKKRITDYISKNSFGWDVDAIVKMLNDIGFIDVYNENLKIQCKKPIATNIKVNDELTVTAEISTKGRYDTTLPMAIMSIANQTVVPKEIIIFDDDKHINPTESSVFAPILRLLEQRGISWKYLFGEKKGQTLNHQKAIDIANTSLIWRVDDDDSAEPNVLESLISRFTPEVGAVGGLIKIPGDKPLSESVCSGKIEDIYSLPHIQWSNFEGTRDVDHLNNSFLFRKSNKYSYDLNLSQVGHREETIFSYRIKKSGYKVLVDGNCITWHMKSPSGGIRSYSNPGLWEHDEKIFEKHIKDWGVIPKNYKLVVLNNGLGDHFTFKEIIPYIKEKYKNVIMSVCYPNAFEKDENIRIISIEDAKILDNDLEKYNIYKYCYERNWKKPLIEVF